MNAGGTRRSNLLGIKMTIARDGGWNKVERRQRKLNHTCGRGKGVTQARTRRQD
jgi:hypothetical protein